MKQPPAKLRSTAAVDTNKIEQHPGRSSFIWLVTVLPGAVVFTAYYIGGLTCQKLKSLIRNSGALSATSILPWLAARSGNTACCLRGLKNTLRLFFGRLVLPFVNKIGYFAPVSLHNLHKPGLVEGETGRGLNAPEVVVNHFPGLSTRKILNLPIRVPLIDYRHFNSSYLYIVADIAGACKVTGCLLFDAAEGVVL